MRKYATFDGRASRSEYWWFALFLTVVILAASSVSEILGSIFGVLLFLPHAAALVRRLHDVGYSGWWFWYPYVLSLLLEITPFGLMGTAVLWFSVATMIYYLWVMVSRGVAFENQYGEPGPECSYMGLKS